MALESAMDFDSLLHSLSKKIKIKLQRDEEETILKQLPAKRDLVTYEKILQLSGEHYPCIHSAIPDLSQQVQMKKSSDGKTVTFACSNIQEAEKAMTAINSGLGGFGYTASYNGNIVTFHTSNATSLSPILSSRNCRILYCEHTKINEIITFGKLKGNPDCDIRKIIREAQEKARKETNQRVTLPNKLKFITKSEIKLPDCEFYNPKFLEFLIRERPTKYQRETYLTLYHLAEIGVPFLYIHERHLVRIINGYYGTPIPTLEKHLMETNDPLHKRLATIFTLAELNAQLHVDFDLIRNNMQVPVT